MVSASSSNFEMRLNHFECERPASTAFPCNAIPSRFRLGVCVCVTVEFSLFIARFISQSFGIFQSDALNSPTIAIISIALAGKIRKEEKKKTIRQFNFDELTNDQTEKFSFSLES